MINPIKEPENSTGNEYRKPSGGSRYSFNRYTCPLCKGAVSEAIGVARHIRSGCPAKMAFIQMLDSQAEMSAGCN